MCKVLMACWIWSFAKEICEPVVSETEDSRGCVDLEISPRIVPSCRKSLIEFSESEQGSPLELALTDRLECTIKYLFTRISLFIPLGRIKIILFSSGYHNDHVFGKGSKYNLSGISCKLLILNFSTSSASEFNAKC